MKEQNEDRPVSIDIGNGWVSYISEEDIIRYETQRNIENEAEPILHLYLLSSNFPPTIVPCSGPAEKTP